MKRDFFQEMSAVPLDAAHVAAKAAVKEVVKPAQSVVGAVFYLETESVALKSPLVYFHLPHLQPPPRSQIPPVPLVSSERGPAVLSLVNDVAAQAAKLGAFKLTHLVVRVLSIVNPPLVMIVSLLVH